MTCFEGNGLRPSHMGVGISQGGVQYTLNATEVHAVAFQMGHTRGNGSGVNMTGKAYSLEAVGNANQAVVTGIFRLDPESSNSMRSSNPYSGCHREDVCHTIDATVPSPSKGQGGMAVVEDVGHGRTGS